jgi:Circularly permutated YpsA SLOG family
MALIKIVSGGQTGVDRGALDAALAAKFPCGGWCPSDRRAEDGPIPVRYPLTPLPGGGYRERTRQNVIDSDGTAIVFYESLTGGTLLTRNLCVGAKKPFIVIDAMQNAESTAAAAIVRFADENQIGVLNVAGPRLSGWPQGQAFAERVVSEVVNQGRRTAK